MTYTQTNRANRIALRAIEAVLEKTKNDSPADLEDLRQDLFVMARSIINTCDNKHASEEHILEACIAFLRRWINTSTRKHHSRLREAGPIDLSNVPSPESLISYQEMLKAIGEALCTLPQHWEKVIRLRYGFAPNEPQSISETANVLGINAGEVAKIEVLAVSLLKHSHLAPKLRSYLPESINEYDDAFVTLRLLRTHSKQICHLDHPPSSLIRNRSGAPVARTYQNLEDIEGAFKHANNAKTTLHPN